MQPLPAAARRSPFRHLIVAAVGALGLVAGAEAAEYRSTVEAATVWYDAPSTKARRLYVVGRGYPVEVLVTLEGWIKVRDAAGSIGWVEAKRPGENYGRGTQGSTIPYDRGSVDGAVREAPHAVLGDHVQGAVEDLGAAVGHGSSTSVEPDGVRSTLQT